MPAQSKQQQKFMGMVHALKKGDMNPSDASPELKKAADSMSSKDAKDFASTKHKGLPKKVKQEIVKKLKEYANKMGTNTMGGDDYTSSKKGGLRDNDGYDNVDYNRNMPMDEGFKSEYKGNDGIIWKKGKTQGGVTNFTPYYKVHNIDFGGRNFKTEKELKDFIKDYILSNQLYNKYRFEGKLPNNWMSGRVSDYHTSLRGKRKDYSDGTNFRKDDSGQPDLEEAQAVSGGKVHKFITGKNITLKGKKYSDVDFELVSIDNKTQIVKLKVLAPKELFGQEINMDFRTLRRGPFLKTNTSMGESVNEAGLKGVEGIPSNKKLSQLSDNDKLKVLQSTGNLISFKVPDWSKGKRNFWTVISAGKIVKKKNLDGITIFILPGKGPEKVSPSYSSVKDLLNGVDWDTMELRRESVNEGDLEDTIHQVKKFDNPKDEKLLTIKVINKLKDKRNKSKSSDSKQKLQQMIDKIEGDYKKGKYIKESVNEELSFDEKQMVIGIIEILKQVDDRKNRMKIALNMLKKFKEEGIVFDYQKFMDALKEYSMGSYEYDKGNRELGEAMIKSMKSVVTKLLPTNTLARHANDPNKNKEFVDKIVRELGSLLNRFYKQNDINVVLQ